MNPADNPDNSNNKSDSTLLLYLGSALVTFALFAFIAFTWGMYTPFLKLFIISIATISFYIAGFSFYRVAKFKDAGITFIILGSISLALSGFGFWNFLFKTQTSIKFSEYWMIHSLVMVLVYWSIMKYTKIRGFIYVILFAVYSLFVSFSVAYFNYPHIRLVVILLLNLFVYLLLRWETDLTHKTNITILVSIFHYIFSLSLFFLLLIASSVSIRFVKFDLVLSTSLLIAITLIYSLQAYLYKSKFTQTILIVEGFTLLPKFLLLALFLQPNVTYKGLWGISLGIYIFGYLLLVACRYFSKLDRHYDGLNEFTSSLVTMLVTSAMFATVFSLIQQIDVGHNYSIIAITMFSYAVSLITLSYIEKNESLRYFASLFEGFLIIALLGVIRLDYHLMLYDNGLEIFGLLSTVVAILTFVEFVPVYKLIKHSKLILSLVLSFFSFYLLALLSFMLSGNVDVIFILSLLLLFTLFYFIYLTRHKYFVYTLLYASYWLSYSFIAILYEHDLFLQDISLFSVIVLATASVSVLFQNIDKIALLQSMSVVRKNQDVLNANIYSVLGLTLFYSVSMELSRYYHDANIISLLVIIIAHLLIAFIFYTSKSPKWIKLASGVPIILILWLFISRSSVLYDVFLFYILPVSFYLYVLAETTKDDANYKPATSAVLSLFAYLSLAYALFVNSLGFGSSNLQLIYGISLIIISAVFLVYKADHKNKLHLYLPIGFIILELVRMFIAVILSIPWWMYVGLTGLFIIAVAIWRISRSFDSNKQNVQNDSNK